MPSFKKITFVVICFMACVFLTSSSFAEEAEQLIEATKLINECKFSEAKELIENNSENMDKAKSTKLLNAVKKLIALEEKAKKSPTSAAPQTIRAIYITNKSLKRACDIMQVKSMIARNNKKWPEDKFVVVTINVTPRGSKVLINGKKYTGAPITVAIPANKEFSVEASKSGYYYKLDYFKLNKDDNNMKISLEKKPKKTSIKGCNKIYKKAMEHVNKLDFDSASKFLSTTNRKMHKEYGPKMMKRVNSLKILKRSYESRQYKRLKKKLKEIAKVKCPDVGLVYANMVKQFKKLINIAETSGYK